MNHISALRIKNTSERIVEVMKQPKQLQRKHRNNSEAPTGFEPVTSAIPVRCSTD